MFKPGALLALTLGGSLFAGVTVPFSPPSGFNFTVNYNGFVDGTLVPGLTAQVTFSNFSFNSATNPTQVQFDYSVYNNSSSPITSSRVGGIGFDTNPEIDVGGSSVSGVFNNVRPGPFPQPTISTGMEFCFNDAPGGGNNCSGSGGGGVNKGNTNGGTAVLKFISYSSSLTALSFNKFYVRYQSIDCPTCSPRIVGGSAVGVNTAVPEPRLILFLSAGVLGVLATRFRRRTTA